MSRAVDNVKIISVEDTSKIEREITYIPCFYEKILSHNSFKLGKEDRWKKLRILSVALYIVILLAYYLFISIASNHVMDSVKYYNFVVPVFATIVFWPFIIVYNSELFHRLYVELSSIFKNTTDKGKQWYLSTAKQSFLLLDDKLDIFTLINAILCVALIVISSIKIIADGFCCLGWVEFIILFFPILASAILTCLFTEKNKNINIVILTIICGLTYYVYLLEFSNGALLGLFDRTFVLGNVVIIVVVVIVFFICGSTIAPMLGVFKMCYFIGFEELIEYPIVGLSSFLSKINKIKRYFMHMTGINLLAYFQLLVSVYLLRIFDRGDITTIALFTLGSFFPLVMYLATSILYKGLCRKIYNIHIKNIDEQIDGMLSCENDIIMSPEKLQALVAVKDMCSNEFEACTKIGVEMLGVVVSTIISVILALSGLG